MATKRPFHCSQGISEKIALETLSVGWELGSTCIRRSIKIFNDDTTSIVEIAVSKEGSYFEAPRCTYYRTALIQPGTPSQRCSGSSGTPYASPLPAVILIGLTAQ